MKTRKCEDCIWFDKCNEQESVCEDYYPASEEECDEMLSKQYVADLDERHKYYQELIKEQEEE